MTILKYHTWYFTPNITTNRAITHTKITVIPLTLFVFPKPGQGKFRCCGPFVEGPENFSGPKGHSLNFNPLIL